jgi:hypothetical protein
MKTLFTLALFLVLGTSFAQCPWSITNPNSTPQYACDQSSSYPIINIGITGSTSDLRYLVTSYPMGASFSPTHAMVTSTNPAQSGVSTNTISVDLLGTYIVKVTNTVTSCEQTGTVNLVSLINNFQLQGYAPSTSVSCNGSVVVNPMPANCSVSASTQTGIPVGSVSGNTVYNLCYSQITVCVTYTTTGSVGCRSCQVIQINGSTGINELSMDKDLIIYPNPSSSFFVIKNEQKDITNVKVFNLEGKLEQVISADDKEIKVNSLKSGIYFIEAHTNNFIYRKKVVVMAD